MSTFEEVLQEEYEVLTSIYPDEIESVLCYLHIHGSLD